MAVSGFLKSKIAAPDIVRLLWLWTIIALAGFARVFYEVYRPVADGLDAKSYMLGRDFVNVWLGAKMAVGGQVLGIYTEKDYMAELQKAFGPDYPQHNFSYPPHIIALILILGLLPYFPALFVWTAAGFAALAASLRKTAGQAWSIALLVILSPASLANVISGQNGAFTAACFLGGLYLCEASPLPAGILFGLLTVKPHLGILIPFVLLLRRNWKCIASASVTTLVLVGFSLILWGVTPWHDYITNVIPYQSALLEDSRAFYHRMTPGVFFDFVRIVPDCAMAIHIVVALMAAGVALFAVKKDGISPRTVMILALSTIIILPYGFNYDMVAIAGALAVYLATMTEEFAFIHLLYGFLWALPLAIYEIKRLPGAPISSLILVSCLIFLHFSRACGKSEIR